MNSFNKLHTNRLAAAAEYFEYLVFPVKFGRLL